MAKIVFSRRSKVLLGVTFAALAVILLVTLILKRGNKNDYPHQAAVVTNGLECGEMTGKILKDGGSVADAAIVALLCEGIALPQATGLGGGFIMTIYRKEANKVETLIARDVAPLAATQNMFVNTTVTGGKAVAVPAELKGYWELHQKYGKLKWSQLFDPVIELCRKGHLITRYLSGVLKNQRTAILASPSLSEVFVDPKTNDLYEEGQLVKRLKLADTLEIIQREGADAIYNNGSVGRTMVEDIQSNGGIITIDDFMQYNVRWEEPISTKLQGNRTLYTVGLPGSGALVAFILNVLNDYLPQEQSVTSMQRITETFKFAYAERTKLGDGHFVEDALKVVEKLTDLKFAMEIRQKIEDFKTYDDYKHYGANFYSQDDHGTAHMNIIAPNGDAISATGTINYLFGSKIVSRTGIILNDGMDDFAVPGRSNVYGVPPSPANFIQPQKMPLSSMCPTILLDENRNVEMMLGAAGGSKISSTIAYVLLRYLHFNEPFATAVNAPRIHHQLAPMILKYEDGMPNSIIDGLSGIGHKMVRVPSDLGFTSLTAIGRKGKELIAVYDRRRGGSIAIF